MTLMQSLRPRDRRAVQIGAAILTSVVLVAKGPAHIQALEADAQAGYLRSGESLQRARQLRDALKPFGLDSGSAMRRLTLLESSALDVRNESEAHSQLAQRISQLAAFAGAQVHEATPTPSLETAPGPRRVAMRIQLTASSPALFTLLRELEVGPTIIRVRRLNLLQPAVADDASVADMLRVELEVVALVRFSTVGRGT